MFRDNLEMVSLHYQTESPSASTSNICQADQESANSKPFVRLYQSNNKLRNDEKLKEDFLHFFLLFMFAIQHWFICRLSDSTVSEDAGIEPRTVVTLALAATDALTTWLDLAGSGCGWDLAECGWDLADGDEI